MRDWPNQHRSEAVSPFVGMRKRSCQQGDSLLQLEKFHTIKQTFTSVGGIRCLVVIFAQQMVLRFFGLFSFSLMFSLFSFSLMLRFRTHAQKKLMRIRAMAPYIPMLCSLLSISGSAHPIRIHLLSESNYGLCTVSLDAKRRGSRTVLAQCLVKFLFWPSVQESKIQGLPVIKDNVKEAYEYVDIIFGWYHSCMIRATDRGGGSGQCAPGLRA